MATIVKITGSVTQKLDKTGTRFTKVYDDAGQIISKTVDVGSKNKSSKFDKLTTYYSKGKPESTVLRKGSFVMAYAKKLIKYKQQTRVEWHNIVFSKPV